MTVLSSPKQRHCRLGYSADNPISVTAVLIIAASLIAFLAAALIISGLVNSLETARVGQSLIKLLLEITAAMIESILDLLRTLPWPRT